MSQEEGTAAVNELMDHAEKAEDGEEPVEWATILIIVNDQSTH